MQLEGKIKVACHAMTTINNVSLLFKIMVPASPCLDFLVHSHTAYRLLLFKAFSQTKVKTLVFDQSHS